MTIPGGKGMFIQGLWFLSPREALDAFQQGALLIDLRSDELLEMKAFGVPEWLHLPHPVLADHAGELPRDRLLILADTPRRLHQRGRQWRSRTSASSRLPA